MTKVHIRSAEFPNVFVRLDGTGVTQFNPSGAGLVNAQYTAGALETFNQIDNGDGSVSFESNAFPNVFLRLDGTGVTHSEAAGGGTVNCQYTAGPWTKYNIVTNDDATTSIGSQHFSNVFLRLDGRGVTQFSPSGGGVVNAQFGHGTWESFVINPCLTPERCNDAINLFIEMYPEEANSINANRQTIIHACCPAYSAPVDLASLAPVQYTLRNVEPRDAGVSPCTFAIGKVVYDCLGLLAAIVGLSQRAAQAAIRATYQVIGERVSTFRQLIDAIRAAPNNYQRALSIGKLIGGFYNVGAFKAWWKVIGGSLHWWEWVVVGVTVVAQIVAWVASGWVAFAAEVVLLLVTVPTLVVDIMSAIKTCNQAVSGVPTPAESPA